MREAKSKEQGARSERLGEGNDSMSGKDNGGLFRFQDLEIWKKAIEIRDHLLDLADDLENKKLYRFAEQLRGASLSISNNIAEGSGSLSKKDFRNFLNIARRSAFENANMLIVFARRNFVSTADKDELLDKLEQECKMILGFMRSLED